MQPVPGTSSMGEPLAPMGSLSAIPGVMTLGTPTPGPGPGPGPGAQQPPVKKIRRKKKDSIFAKIARVLEDDRVKRGDKDMTMKLRTVNRLQDASELQILKKILNIIFLITGAALLLGVIVVIVYTAVCEYPPELEIKDYVEYYHIPEMPTDIHVMSIDEADGDERFEDFVKPIDNIPPEEGATDDRKEWPIFESVDPAVDYDDPAVDPTPDRRRPDPGGERRPDADPPDPADPETPETPENDYTFFEPKEPPDLYAADGYT